MRSYVESEVYGSKIEIAKRFFRMVNYHMRKLQLVLNLQLKKLKNWQDWSQINRDM